MFQKPQFFTSNNQRLTTIQTCGPCQNVHKHNDYCKALSKSLFLQWKATPPHPDDLSEWLSKLARNKKQRSRLHETLDFVWNTFLYWSHSMPRIIMKRWHVTSFETGALEPAADVFSSSGRPPADPSLKQLTAPSSCQLRHPPIFLSCSLRVADDQPIPKEKRHRHIYIYIYIYIYI